MDAMWLALYWGSPIGLGVFFMGLGVLFWGIAQANSARRGAAPSGQERARQS